MLHTLQGHQGAVYGVTVSDDGKRAVSASEDQTLSVWDVETGQELRILRGHACEVGGVSVSGNGRRCVSASFDGTLMVWDLQIGKNAVRIRHTEGESIASPLVRTNVATSRPLTIGA